MPACCRPTHGSPPFILVCDVGHCFEVYADFAGTGKELRAVPRSADFRIYLEDLRKPEDVRERLAESGLDPARSIRPGSAKVTREIAERLARSRTRWKQLDTPGGGRDVPDAVPFHDVR